jgi:hypothetical protein
LRREAGVEVAKQDFIDIAGGDTGVVKRTLGSPYDKAFYRLAFEASERRMSPADDACSHDGLLAEF